MRLYAVASKIRTTDLAIPWDGPWKLDFGACSGALAKLGLKRRFGASLGAGKGGSTIGSDL